MDALTELAIKYKVDKWGKHHYTPTYYQLFKDKRNSVKKVLEIGIAEGASLDMWHEFFPNAEIFGADNDEKRVMDMQDQGFAGIYLCDQSKGVDLRFLIQQTGPDIDLVIDDGSHKPSDQLFTALITMPLLEDPIYVIEDFFEPDDLFILHDYDYEIKRVGKRYDDCLVIIQNEHG